MKTNEVHKEQWWKNVEKVAENVRKGEDSYNAAIQRREAEIERLREMRQTNVNLGRIVFIKKEIMGLVTMSLMEREDKR